MSRLTYTLSPLLLSLMTPSALLAESKERPNVVLIYADDLGYGDLSCYGAWGLETPNVDRLAKRGVRFTNAHAAAATSTPSRYGMLTGEYAWRRPGTDVAAGDAAMIIKPNQFTLADLFRGAGYRTAAIGKWHLGLGSETGKQNWNKPLDQGLKDLGFDYSYIMAATADRVPSIFIENDAIANPDPEHPIEVSYEKPFAGEPLGKDRPDLLQLHSSHGHDMAIVNGIGRIGYSRGGGKALWQDENIADSITRKAQAFIREHQDKPFFLYFATNDPHVPRFPHPRFRGKSKLGLRGDAIVQFDWSVGEIMKTLDELGIADNTLIILTSDNGAVLDDGYKDEAYELLGKHKPTGNLRGNKYSTYEGGTRVPLIVAWGKEHKKAKRAGKISTQLYSQIDLMASLGELIGSSIPEQEGPDSRAHLPALLGKAGAKGSPWLIQQAANKTLSLRMGDWKYISPSDGPASIAWARGVESGYNKEPQLYNLKQDPSERRNLAKRYPKILRRMQRILAKEVKAGSKP